MITVSVGLACNFLPLFYYNICEFPRVSVDVYLQLAPLFHVYPTSTFIHFDCLYLVSLT